MTRNEYPRANHADIFFLCQRFMPSTVGTTPIFTGCDTCNSTSYTLKNSDVFFSRALNNRSPLFCLLHLHWPTLNSETIAEFLIAQKSLTRVFGLGTTWLTALGYFRTFQFFERNCFFFFLSVIDDFQMIVIKEYAVHERVDEFPASLQLPDVYLSEIA